MAISHYRFILLLAGSSLALNASAAWARQPASATTEASGASEAGAPQPANPELPQQASDIVVTGTRASLESAEQTKRYSDVLVDGISADDIGALPDVSIADSLVRIPGITANDTEAGFDQASVRGLGPDLTQITFNGRLLATPGPGARRFPVGDLPTEGIGAAYVLKTSAASALEGGLSGTIDLRSIHPLDTRRQGLTLVGRVLLDDVVNDVGKAYHFKKLGYRAEATYVGRLADNLGVALTYAHISQTNVSPGVQFDGYKTRAGASSDLDGDGIPDAIPANAGINIGASTQNRDSVLGTMQWAPTNSLKVTLDGLYVRNHGNSNATRFFGANLAAAGRAVPASSSVVNDTIVALQGDNQAGLYQIVENDTGNKQRQFESGLNIAFDNGGPIKFKVDGYYTSASRDTQTRQIQMQNVAANATAQKMPLGYDFQDPDHVSLDFASLGASDYAVSNINLGSQHNSDRIMGLGADFSYDAGAPWLKSIDFGLRVDGRRNIVSPDNQTYAPTNFASRIALDDSYLYSDKNPFAPFASRLGGDSAVSFPLYNVEAVAALASDPRFTPNDQEGNDLAGYSNISEVTYALYAQANLKRGPLSGNVGVRWFVTDETIRGFLGASADAVLPQRISHSYSFLLPSLNLRYEFTHSLIGRFAASETISRPVFGDMKVGSNIDLDAIEAQDPTMGVTINRGNPDLKPFQSKNLDASVEWYPDSHTSFAAQGFFKAVNNFITAGNTTSQITLPDGSVRQVFINYSVNDPKVRHFYGFELMGRRDFNFLPGFLRNTGLRVDYSHNWTDAIATSNSVVVVADPKNTGAAANSDSAIVTPNNFEPDILNAQFYYSAKGIDMRVAYRYYSSYFRSAFNSYQSHPGGQLDLSGSVAVFRGIRLIGTIVNLTKTNNIQYFPDKRELGGRSQLLRAVIYNGRTITLGVRAHF